MIRGEEWINSAPKHLLLSIFWLASAGVVSLAAAARNPDKSKLSKRKNPTSINYYRRMGYLPEALLNYLRAWVGLCPMKLKNSRWLKCFSILI
ncbi:MAG: glutamate--tRNA ligase family protein [Pseudomonadales bacterium]